MPHVVTGWGTAPGHSTWTICRAAVTPDSSAPSMYPASCQTVQLTPPRTRRVEHRGLVRYVAVQAAKRGINERLIAYPSLDVPIGWGHINNRTGLLIFTSLEGHCDGR